MNGSGSRAVCQEVTMVVRTGEDDGWDVEVTMQI